MLGSNPGKSSLDRIEDRLQSLIEGSLSSLVSWGGNPQTLSHALIKALHADLHTGEDGQPVAPGNYTIQVNPERLPYWQADPKLLEIVREHFSRAAREQGINFSSGPSMHLAVDPSLALNAVRVVTSQAGQSLEDTAVLLANHEPPSPKENLPQNAFLIVNGDQIFPLRQAVVNIGRRLDNHLAIDDPRVSRSHAQLRAIHGQYVLFDLNSTGGTYVNGQRINQYRLNPGDVISLAGVPMIFGQEIPPQADQSHINNPGLSPGTTQSLRSTPGKTSHKK